MCKETNVSTYEEIIRLIQARVSEAKWEKAQNKKLERIEEENLHWKVMQMQMQDDSHDDIELKENLVINIPNVKKGEVTTSWKHKVLQEVVPTIEE